MGTRFARHTFGNAHDYWSISPGGHAAAKSIVQKMGEQILAIDGWALALRHSLGFLEHGMKKCTLN
jgi:hypothetical protein